jgi:hypothetical protein
MNTEQANVKRVGIFVLGKLSGTILVDDVDLSAFKRIFASNRDSALVYYRDGEPVLELLEPIQEGTILMSEYGEIMSINELKWRYHVE